MIPETEVTGLLCTRRRADDIFIAFGIEESILAFPKSLFSSVIHFPFSMSTSVEISDLREGSCKSFVSLVHLSSVTIIFVSELLTLNLNL